MVVMIPMALVLFLAIEIVMPNNSGSNKPILFFLDCNFWRELCGCEVSVSDPEKP